MELDFQMTFTKKLGTIKKCHGRSRKVKLTGLLNDEENLMDQMFSCNIALL